MTNQMTIKQQDVIYAVGFNSAGGWDSSQAYRVTAVTENYVAAIATDEPEYHNTRLNAWGCMSYPIAHRVVIVKEFIDPDGAFTLS